MYATPATKRTLFKKARGQRRVLDRVAGLFTGHATPEGGQPPPPQGAPVGARGEQGRRNATADLGRHQGVAAAVEARRRRRRISSGGTGPPCHGTCHCVRDATRVASLFACILVVS